MAQVNLNLMDKYSQIQAQIDKIQKEVGNLWLLYLIFVRLG